MTVWNIENVQGGVTYSHTFSKCGETARGRPVRTGKTLMLKKIKKVEQPSAHLTHLNQNHLHLQLRTQRTRPRQLFWNRALSVHTPRRIQRQQCLTARVNRVLSYLGHGFFWPFIHSFPGGDAVLTPEDVARTQVHCRRAGWRCTAMWTFSPAVQSLQRPSSYCLQAESEAFAQQSRVTLACGANDRLLNLQPIGAQF